MTTVRLSASAIERLHNCPTSAALPAVYVTGDAAEQGTDNHAAVEVAARNYRDHGVIPDGPLGELLRGCTVLAIERALVVDVVTQRVRDLGEGVGRAYGELGPTEVACTVDIVIRHADGRVSVYDWKSRSRVTSAARNWQVKVQALAVLGWLSEQAVQAGLVYLDDWQADVAEFDALDCAAIASELVELRERLTRAKAEDPVHLGKWCDYCPAQFGCPGRKAVVESAMQVANNTAIEVADAAVKESSKLREVAGELLAMLTATDIDEQKKLALRKRALRIINGSKGIETRTTLATTDDEKAGEAYTKIAASVDMLMLAKDILRARAQRSPLPLPNGKRLAQIEFERTDVDNAGMRKILESQGIAIPMRTSTITQLREVK